MNFFIKYFLKKVINEPQKYSRVSNVIYTRKEEYKSCSSLQMFLFNISDPEDLTS